MFNEEGSEGKSLHFMDPNTRVAIKNLNQKTIGAKLKTYNNNLAEGPENMCMIKDKIIDSGGTIDDMVLHLFSFL